MANHKYLLPAKIEKSSGCWKMVVIEEEFKNRMFEDK